MSDGYEQNEHEARLGASTASPAVGTDARGRVLRSFAYRVMNLLLCVVVVVFAALVGFQIGKDQSAPEGEAIPKAEVLLSDVRGDDVLHRLQITQAALRREITLLRERASQGGEALPADVDTAHALAVLQENQSRLGAQVRHLEARQNRLDGLVTGMQTGLAEQRQRLIRQEQVLQERLPSERN